jgi:hypothetical protein
MLAGMVLIAVHKYTVQKQSTVISVLLQEAAPLLLCTEGWHRRSER